MTGLAITRGDIARTYAGQGKLSEAKALQRQRLETNQKVGDRQGIAATTWELAQIALAVLQIALPTAERLHATGLIERINAGLALCAEHGVGGST